MENIEQYAHGAEHEVHVHCKRSLSTLILSLFVLMQLVDKEEAPTGTFLYDLTMGGLN